MKTKPTLLHYVVNRVDDKQNGSPIRQTLVTPKKDVNTRVGTPKQKQTKR